MAKTSRGERPKRAIVFDGDDTLWDTQVLYEDAKREFVRLLREVGHNPVQVAAKLAEIDTRNVGRWGLSPRRFPTSMRETYLSLCQQTGELVRDDIAHQVEAIAESVFAQAPVVRPEAAEVLRLLAPSYRLILFTAGDKDVQWSRLRESGLQPSFDGVRVTPEKSVGTWASLLRSEALPPSSTWSVGNSIRSDINPALELKLRCVLLSGGTWEFEHAAVSGGHVWYAKTLHEVVTIILKQDGFHEVLGSRGVASDLSPDVGAPGRRRTDGG